MKKRNCTIDLMKFVMALMIAFFHFYMATGKHFIGGSFAVEIFLLAASLFFFAKLERETAQRVPSSSESSPYIYIRNRFMRFFPWTFSAFVFLILITGNFPPQNKNVIDFLLERLSEIFLIFTNGISAKIGALNGVTWTISAMLIVEFIMCYLFVRHKKALTEFITPLSIVLGLGYWINKISGSWASWVGFTTYGLFRTWIAYCAGYLSYLLAKRIKEIKFNWRGRVAVTVVEIAGYIISIAMMMTSGGIYYWWTCTAIMAVTLAISFSGVSLLEELLSGRILAKVCGYLGKLSFSIYLMHWGVFKVFNSRLSDPETRYSYKWYYLLCFMSCAVLQLIIIPPVVKLIKRFWTWLKRTLTAQERKNNSDLE